MFACAPECGCTLAFSAPKSCKQAVDGQSLDDVDELAAAVVASAGIALGVFVGEHRALRGHDGGAGVVLGGDHLQALLLALALALDRLPDVGVGLFEKVHAILTKSSRPSGVA